jgi:hypothetical protein
LFLAFIHAALSHAEAQTPDPVPAAAAAETPASLDFEGPPVPVAPDVVSRDAAGRATIRATRLDEPLRIDGRLDEPVYERVRAVSDLVQVEPEGGAPATEKTEVWLTFDRQYVYVSVRCWDTAPDRRVATEMRRDNNATWNGNDVVSIFFDPFYDRRNGMGFTINAIGGRNDGQVTNERQYAGDWNPIYDFAVGRFEGGWTVEFALPFKSVRYRPGTNQVWGFNLLRTNRWKNELSLITRIPPGRGMQSVQQASLAATVVGIDTPQGGRNLDLKPYFVSSLTTDRTATPRISNAFGREFGFDLKSGLPHGLVGDFTYNTDFAQVEADEAQVNLTRFSLFFPEKREFFLENQGTFSFGGVATAGNNAGTNDAPVLFYSRRIGLEGGRVVPLIAGGRVTGRVGRYSLGALDIQTDDERAVGAKATNLSVVRLKRDILRRSSIGAMATGRSMASSGAGSSLAYGVDGTFGFFNDLTINSYWARTRAPGVSRDDTSYRAQLDYNADRYGLQLEHLAVGDNFNPQVGFVRRDDMRRSSVQARFSPRPRALPSIRRLSWTGGLNYVDNSAGRLETREQNGEFAIEFLNSDRLSVGYTDTHEFLPRPFTIARGVTLPVAAYDFGSARVGLSLGVQRPLSGTIAVEHGRFYNGQRSSISVSRGRLSLTPRLSLEPSYAVNRVELDQGDFTTHLLASRVTYTMNPRLFTSALVQYTSASNAVAANVRVRWEYQPGSELFVVFNEDRDTRARSFPGLSTRSVIVKINRLFRY